MTEEPAAVHPSWLKIGGIGCAVALALAALAVGAIVSLTFRGYGRGFEVEGQLDRAYGQYESYRIPPHGTIPPDRLDRFIAVRRALIPRCAEVSDVTGSFARVQAAAREPDPDVPGLFDRAGAAIRRLPRVGLVFGAYVNDRNKALLDNGMGLGEYTWIYVVGYFGLLQQPPSAVLPSSDRPDVFRDRVFPETARLIERHIEQAGITTGPWVDELARLRDDPGHVPFSGTLPPELAASLEPHHQALAGVACPEAAELDVTVTVKRGTIGYDHR